MGIMVNLLWNIYKYNKWRLRFKSSRFYFSNRYKDVSIVLYGDFNMKRNEYKINNK